MQDKLLPLKMTVYVMGVMLLGGFLWLGGRLALKANEITSHCAEVTLTLPEGATLQQLPTLQGESWVAHATDVNQTPVIYRFDHCGRLLQTVQYPAR